MANTSKSGLKSFLGKFFSNPPEEDDEDEVMSGENDPSKSVYNTLHGDKIVPVVEGDYYYSNKNQEEENYMRQTNINSDMSAYTSNNINMKVMKPDFSFSAGDLTLEQIEEHCKEIIDALKDGQTVFLDFDKLGDGERSVATYVILGAVNALGYGMTNIRDYVMYVLTPPGVNVSQDDRIKFDVDDDRRLRYSNDY